MFFHDKQIRKQLKLILSKTLRNDYKGFHKQYTKKLQNGSVDSNGPYVWVHTKELIVKENGKNVKSGTFEKIEEF